MKQKEGSRHFERYTKAKEDNGTFEGPYVHVNDPLLYIIKSQKVGSN